jgi:hypothetical protein
MYLPPSVASQFLQYTKLEGVGTPFLHPHAFKTNLEGLGMCLSFPSTFHDFQEKLEEDRPFLLVSPSLFKNKILKG